MHRPDDGADIVPRARSSHHRRTYSRDVTCTIALPKPRHLRHAALPSVYRHLNRVPAFVEAKERDARFTSNGSRYQRALWQKILESHPERFVTILVVAIAHHAQQQTLGRNHSPSVLAGCSNTICDSFSKCSTTHCHSSFPTYMRAAPVVAKRPPGLPIATKAAPVFPSTGASALPGNQSPRANRVPRVPRRSAEIDRCSRTCAQGQTLPGGALRLRSQLRTARSRNRHPAMFCFENRIRNADQLRRLDDPLPGRALHAEMQCAVRRLLGEDGNAGFLEFGALQDSPAVCGDIPDGDVLGGL